MRAQFRFMQLLGAFVIVTALDAADSFVADANAAGKDSQPSMTGNSNLAYAGVDVDKVYYPHATGDRFSKESAGADAAPTPIWPAAVEARQWKTTDPIGGNPAEQVGFFDVIRSLTNVFTGLVGRPSNPAAEYFSTESVVTETPTPIDGEASQHSEEDTVDEDVFDGQVIAPVADVPIAVRLAQVKQLVKTRFAPRPSPNIYDGYPPFPTAEDPRLTPASVHRDVILMPGEHVSDNFGCNNRICLWKK